MASSAPTVSSAPLDSATVMGNNTDVSHAKTAAQDPLGSTTMASSFPTVSSAPLDSATVMGNNTDVSHAKTAAQDPLGSTTVASSAPTVSSAPLDSATVMGNNTDVSHAKTAAQDPLGSTTMASSAPTVSSAPLDSATVMGNNTDVSHGKTAAQDPLGSTTMASSAPTVSSAPLDSATVMGNNTDVSHVKTAAQDPRLGGSYWSSLPVDKQIISGRIPLKKDTTTLMFKNIPYEYGSDILLNLVDEHCFLWNSYIDEEGSRGDEPTSGYDFFYLVPSNSSLTENRGFAFVNFTSPRAAQRFHISFHKWRWGSLPNYNIECKVYPARIQGMEALRINFEGNSNIERTHMLRPMFFDTPRSGLEFKEWRLLGWPRTMVVSGCTEPTVIVNERDGSQVNSASSSQDSSIVIVNERDGSHVNATSSSQNSVTVNAESSSQNSVTVNAASQIPCPRGSWWSYLPDDKRISSSSTTLEEDTTTVMLRNIPYNLRSVVLLNLLDEHCYQWNQYLDEERRAGVEPTSEYDFVYLIPSRTSTAENRGYAFINFTSPRAAQRFYKSFHGWKWGAPEPCKIVSQVSPAKIQGMEALLHNFLGKCRAPTYIERPMFFHTPRRGFDVKEWIWPIWVAPQFY